MSTLPEICLYLHSVIMKSLKVLFLFIVTFVFLDGAESVSCAASLESKGDVPMEIAVCSHGISAADSELCLPRQVSFAGPLRVQSGARRTGGVQRTGLEFAKAGKIINSGIRYYIQKKALINHSSLTEPMHVLLSQGKLII